MLYLYNRFNETQRKESCHEQQRPKVALLSVRFRLSTVPQGLSFCIHSCHHHVQASLKANGIEDVAGHKDEVLQSFRGDCFQMPQPDCMPLGADTYTEMTRRAKPHSTWDKYP